MNPKKVGHSTELIIIVGLCCWLTFCASATNNLQKQQEKDPRYQYNMGLFYLNNGNPDQAIQYFNKSLKLNSNSFLTYNGLGLAYLMKHELEKARDYFQKALSLNPKFSEAHNYLGTVFQEMGLLEQAEKEYRSAVADPDYKSKELPYYNLARLYLLKNQLQEALFYVNQSLEINKTMVMAYNLKGIILEKQEKFQEAIDNYLKGLKYAKDDINLNFNLAVAYFKNKDFDHARELFEKILLQSPDPDMKAQVNEYLKIINKRQP